MQIKRRSTIFIVSLLSIPVALSAQELKLFLMQSHIKASLRQLVVAIVLVISAVSLAGCGHVPDLPPAKAGAVSLAASDWYLFYGSSIPDHPLPSAEGAWSIQIPSSEGKISYLQTPFRAVARPNKVAMTFRVNASSDARYNGLVDPNCHEPATFHIFLERRHDDLASEYYRFWSQAGRYDFGSMDGQVVTLEAPLTFDKWTSVYGNTNKDEFEAALSDLGWVGLTFGCRNQYGHGVNMSSGTSELTLLDYRVE